jgi:uncharacterized protein YdaU (DUF1376 family)
LKTFAPVIGKIDAVNGVEADSAPQMAKMPWYPRDFASATRGWPLVARAAYRELLDAQWDMGSLPDSEAEMRTIASATPAEWRVSWRYIERKFPLATEGRRRNARLESHRRKALLALTNRQAGADLTNRKRWPKQ